MCYLIAKSQFKPGCVVLEIQHEIEITSIIIELGTLAFEKGIQIIIANTQGAYKKYSPYKKVESLEEFIDKINYLL